MRSFYLNPIARVIVSCGFILAAPAFAEETSVAVAANFLNPLKEIAAGFEKETGNRVSIVSGSTGKLYAQIVNGAPYDVFLAADDKHVKLLEDRGAAVLGSRSVYAVGRLALWSKDSGRVQGDGAEVLRRGGFQHLAIANPKTAPYGKAAVQAMQALGVWEKVQSTVVQGENIGQAFQFASSGNAELGFVALSDALAAAGKGNAGSRWDVPDRLHDPLVQEMVLLQRARDNPSARAFMEYMRGEKARAVILRLGYGFTTENAR